MWDSLAPMTVRPVRLVHLWLKTLALRLLCASCDSSNVIWKQKMKQTLSQLTIKTENITCLCVCVCVCVCVCCLFVVVVFLRGLLFVCLFFNIIPKMVKFNKIEMNVHKLVSCSCCVLQSKLTQHPTTCRHFTFLPIECLSVSKLYRISCPNKRFRYWFHTVCVHGNIHNNDSFELYHKVLTSSTMSYTLFSTRLWAEIKVTNTKLKPKAFSGSCHHAKIGGNRSFRPLLILHSFP